MSYDIVLIGTILIIAYISSYSLYRYGIMDKKVHNRIWNIIFLLVFLIAMGVGFLLTALTDLGFYAIPDSNLLFWHGELGIFFIFTLLFHLQINWSSLSKLILKTG
jgi:high-affinity K+ transport system ATPase subunit B